MIVKVTKENLEEYLKLMHAYQIFYQVETNREKNKIFFENFLDKPEQAVMSLYIHDKQAVGLSTIYFTYASTITSKVAVLNDLFVLEPYRKQGIGRALIEDAVSKIKLHGCARLQWVTAQDNLKAQALYQSMQAKESVWNFYTLS